jgi:hypothetical protein
MYVAAGVGPLKEDEFTRQGSVSPNARKNNESSLVENTRRTDVFARLKSGGNALDPVSEAARIFFVTDVLTACSYLLAERLANRLGLLRTMVFTHLPSRLCLLALPFWA